jgi:cystathionine gamma-synthase
MVIGSLELAYATTYSSGMSAMFSLLNYMQPSKMLMSKKGYHGSHQVVASFSKGRKIVVKYLEDGYALDDFKKGDLIWLESPLNPCGEVQDLQLFSKRGRYV